MSRRRSINEGASHNDASREINRFVYKKKIETYKVCDAWRKALAEDPNLQYRMTFLEFKRKFFRKNRGVKNGKEKS